MVMVISDVVYCGRDALAVHRQLPAIPRSLVKRSDPDSMLVLASASPRRQELLRNAGIPHTVSPANVPETLAPGETPREFAMRVAAEKARCVWQRLYKPSGTMTPPLFVLGADTVVLIDDLVLGKPVNAEDACRMLRLLSGRAHDVLTAVCLIGAQEGKCFEDTRAEITRVYFDHLREEEIRSYVEQGEPMDKAGAYAIQGTASRWIRKLEGDYANVVGLPVRLVYRMLREHGAM
jgi:septum formation protein